MALIICVDIDISRFTSIFLISRFECVNICARHPHPRQITVHIFKMTMASFDARQNQCEYVLIQIKFRDEFTFCKIYLNDFSVNTFLRDGEREYIHNLSI